MAVSSELSAMLNAIAGPALLVRPDDMTVAAANSAFGRAYGAFRYEGQCCWQALHRAHSCSECGLDCPLLQGQKSNKATQVTQVVFANAGITRLVVEMTPIFSSDGTPVYWLECFHEEKTSQSRLTSTGLVGVSAQFLATLEQIRRVAESDIPVMLYGPVGVGRELYARTVHENSRRAAGPFVAISATALTTGNARSVLFGHKTESGAVQAGLLSRARGGSLFIDDVDRLPLEIQDKLVEILERGLFCPEGGNTVELASFRLLVASRFTAQQLAAAGKLCTTLAPLLRACVVSIQPLNARREDIIPLAEHYLSHLSGKKQALTEQARARLQAADWGGDERELKAVIEGVSLLGKSVIEAEDLAVSPSDAAPQQEFFAQSVPVVALDELRNLYIAWALKVYPGSRAELAEKLGVSERTLYRRVCEAKLACRALTGENTLSEFGHQHVQSPLTSKTEQ